MRLGGALDDEDGDAVTRTSETDACGGGEVSMGAVADGGETGDVEDSGAVATAGGTTEGARRDASPAAASAPTPKRTATTATTARPEDRGSPVASSAETLRDDTPVAEEGAIPDSGDSGGGGRGGSLSGGST